MAKKNFFRATLFGILFILLFATKIAELVTDYLWFDSLGLKDVFLIGLKSKLLVFFIAAIIFFIFAFINIKISSGNTDKKWIPFKSKIFLLSMLAIIFGLFTYNSWYKILQFFHGAEFGVADPIFARDISFYIFSLPFYNMLWKFAMFTLVVTTILVILDYLQDFLANFFKNRQGEFEAKQENEPKKDNFDEPIPSYTFDMKNIFSTVKRKATIHLSILGVLFFGLLSVKHYLKMYSVLYSKKGIIVGARYADVMMYIPMIKILIVCALIIALMFVVYIFYISKQQKLKKKHILTYLIFIYVLFVFVGPSIFTNLVQSLKVTPNEMNLEKPYIEYNIKFTKQAYGLTDVEEKELTASLLTKEHLLGAEETLDNVRILDWRPLTKTYKQTQEIRLYYDLANVDIDRYHIDGKYTQVMLSPRELDKSQVPEEAKTWVNLHLIYTHGYGVVMSPVNKVTSEGLPDYLIKDIPPVYSVEEPEIRIEKPQIYFGETRDDYVLVKTKAKEFDYPKGNLNEYNNYDGKDGVLIDTFTKKVLMAIKFGDIKILLSSDVTPESKILYYRNIQDRIAKVMPNLQLDKDPYIVISDGRIKFIQDAYTISDNYPYSERVFYDKYYTLNYIRNSVKVVVDAYDGDMTFYVSDANDPIIRTMQNIYPGVFVSIDEMSQNLRSHVRYPEELFKIQSQIFATYHMNNSAVFYNKEDAWQIPTEIYGTGQQVQVEPYYIIMGLPGEDKEEFVIMTSFAPTKKDNMIAWMAARADKENYGHLIVYKLPKDKLVYGPLQIEAKFDQDSIISQQLTLWSQQGSRVTRGNLLVIPIKDSLLYVEPLYIQAETGQLPELKRVLVSDGEKVVMEKTLSEALDSLFGKDRQKESAPAGEENSENQSDKFDGNGIISMSGDEELKEQADAIYSSMQESLKTGDLAKFGEEFKQLGIIIDELVKE